MAGHSCIIYQVEGEATPGTRIKGRILDVNKKDGIVDLTLKAALVAAVSKKAAKATQPEVTCSCFISYTNFYKRLFFPCCPPSTAWKTWYLTHKMSQCCEIVLFWDVSVQPLK